MAAVLVLWIATVTRGEPRVLIVSIDGLRPDVALRADMPTLRGLMSRGSFTFLATTTPAAITLPSHTSMLTGVTIERHGISGNDDDDADAAKLRATTIFELAKAAGISSGMAAGKSKFSLFDPAIDYPWHPEPKPATTRDSSGRTVTVLKGVVAADEVTADHAVQIITAHRPRLMFVQFGYNDSIGHSKGWGSAAQVKGLANTDTQLGRVVAALKGAGVLEETTIILSADHGGVARVHGATVEGSLNIPWIIAGPGVKPNVDLSQYRERPIRTYDTFATACDVLGLKPAADIDGRTVSQAFEKTELLTPTMVPGGASAGVETPATQP
jgi:arylsulfatase A-like enzyme